MDRHELAWAAGFFDGEGWANRSGRGVQSRINQAGADGAPEVLLKFHRIVGVGRIKGPLILEGKEDLYWWQVSSRVDVARVAELIGPWLCQVKRAEFESVVGWPLGPIAWPGTKSEELAWAGGFFDGEGSTYLLRHRTHVGHFTPAVEVPQSGWHGVPIVLTRFRAALDGIGNISGPYEYTWADAPVTRWKTEALNDVQLALHRLMPFIGPVKRAQALGVLEVINSQVQLSRGNPAFGQAGARFCLRGHDKWAARRRPYVSRGADRDSKERRQCLQCLRERARAKRRQRR